MVVACWLLVVDGSLLLMFPLVGVRCMLLFVMCCSLSLRVVLYLLFVVCRCLLNCLVLFVVRCCCLLCVVLVCCFLCVRCFLSFVGCCVLSFVVVVVVRGVLLLFVCCLLSIVVCCCSLCVVCWWLFAAC